MHEYIELIPKLFVPENLIKIGGLGLLIFIVFAETGLFVGFFLPGDSLLFTAGILCSTKTLNIDIFTLMLLLNIAAIAGNLTGYFFGKRVGPKLFTRDDSLIFKKRYVFITRTFYNKYGGKALIMGRFLPIIRTFAPILSGVVQFDLKKFIIYTVAGSILWTSAMTLSAFYLTRLIPNLKNHLGLVVILMIVITAIPVFRTYLREKKTSKSQQNSVNS